MASCVEARNVLKSVFLEQYRSFQQRRLTRAVMADERPWRSQVDSHFFLLIDCPTKFLSDRPLTFYVGIWHAGASSDYVLHFSNFFLTLGRYVPEGVSKLRYTKLGTDLSVHAVRGWQAVM